MKVKPKHGFDLVIDFDGTVVTHEYPDIGRDIGAVPVLQDLISNGHRLILFTMRSGQHLEAAVEWFKSNGIELYGIQTNPTQKTWTDSPKAYGQVYLDDAALGIPLVYPPPETITGPKETFIKAHRPYVDWIAVRRLLIDRKLLVRLTNDQP